MRDRRRRASAATLGGSTFYRFTSVDGSGGVGGVGETLDALRWERVRAELTGIRAEISRDQFETLEPINRRTGQHASRVLRRSSHSSL